MQCAHLQDAFHPNTSGPLLSNARRQLVLHTDVAHALHHSPLPGISPIMLE